MPNFPKWSDTKFRVFLKTVKLTRLSSKMDKKCYEKSNICTNVKNCKILEVLKVHECSFENLPIYSN